MELEFSVDPLFKKVAADFDEGGAKGLLLNHLAIDGSGRIVFDSSDDTEDATAGGEEEIEHHTVNEHKETDASAPENVSEETRPPEIDLQSLGAKFFPDLEKLEEQHICPSLRTYDLSNPDGSLDIPMLKAPEAWKHDEDQDQARPLSDQTGVFLDGDNVAGFDDDDGALGGFDVGGNAGFGEGGDDWARNAVLEPQANIRDVGFEEGNLAVGQDEGFGVGGLTLGDNQYTVSMNHHRSANEHEDILSYFDNAMQKNWAGPEHWRIRRIKDQAKTGPAPSKRKEKEPFEIDFNAALDHTLAEALYAPAASNSAISLPKTQWKSKTRNLLPDDKHFNSRQLLHLFLKPKARIGSRRVDTGRKQHKSLEAAADIEGEMDEAFWAKKGNDVAAAGEEARTGDYDANFFQDDGLGFADGPEDEEFADAREIQSPDGADPAGAVSESADGRGPTGSQEGGFGTQLVTQSRRLRPEYVQYARVAKKVDVRRLKEEMWKGTGFEEVSDRARTYLTRLTIKQTNQPKDADMEMPAAEEPPPLKFTSVMNNLQTVYPKEAMADISTSYCFICLLHLANEKGLTINSEPGLEELNIRRDFTAEIVEREAS